MELMQNTRSRTRRRVVARSIVTLMLAGLLLVAVVPRLLATTEMGEPTYHLVAPGDTLWSLAGRYAPEADPRGFVFEVQRLNGLEGVVLLPGERLLLPAS